MRMYSGEINSWMTCTYVSYLPPPETPPELVQNSVDPGIEEVLNGAEDAQGRHPRVGHKKNGSREWIPAVMHAWRIQDGIFQVETTLLV